MYCTRYKYINRCHHQEELISSLSPLFVMCGDDVDEDLCTLEMCLVKCERVPNARSQWG